MTHTLRLAVPEDAEALLAIYAPYVSGTAVSFETAVPSVIDFAQRIAEISLHLPYLVCLAGGAPVGYAYASRPASARRTATMSRHPSMLRPPATALAWRINYTAAFWAS